MIFKIACVGKIKESYYIDMIQAYEKRITKQHQFKICQVEDERIPKKASDAESSQLIVCEGRRLAKVIQKTDYVIALCIEGKQCSTEEIGRLCHQAWDRGFQTITFVIGGSLGLSPELVKRADYKLSFSAMTFPHQLMRVMLTQQISAICDM